MLAKPIIIFYFLLISGFVIFSQKKPETRKAINPPTSNTPLNLTDSTVIISFRDIQQFNAFLKNNVSFDAYTKLSPETTLSELWAWKINQLKSQKQMVDTLIKKK